MGDLSVLLRSVASQWWILALRGLLAVIFGVLALMWPGPTLAALVLFFAAFAIVDGILALVVGFRSKWWGVALLGLLGITAGILTFMRPGITALALLYLIAGWAIVRGVFEIVGAIQLRRELENEWLLILSGLASIAFGVLVLVYPGAGALSIVWLIGAFAIWIGLLMLFLAFRLKKLPERLAAA
jgi:uncharacterized membrane protein HdeD (DUF308 family)